MSFGLVQVLGWVGENDNSPHLRAELRALRTTHRPVQNKNHGGRWTGQAKVWSMFHRTQSTHWVEHRTSAWFTCAKSPPLPSLLFATVEARQPGSLSRLGSLSSAKTRLVVHVAQGGSGDAAGGLFKDHPNQLFTFVQMQCLVLGHTKTSDRELGRHDTRPGS